MNERGKNEKMAFRVRFDKWLNHQNTHIQKRTLTTFVSQHSLFCILFIIIEDHSQLLTRICFSYPSLSYCTHNDDICTHIIGIAALQSTVRPTLNWPQTRHLCRKGRLQSCLYELKGSIWRSGMSWGIWNFFVLFFATRSTISKEEDWQWWKEKTGEIQ